jgi:hypothetical protein
MRLGLTLTTVAVEIEEAMEIDAAEGVTNKAIRLGFIIRENLYSEIVRMEPFEIC